MLNKVIAKVAKVAVGKHLVSGLAWIHDKLDGHKSEILTGLLVIVHGLKLAGLVDPVIADTVEAALGGAIPVSLMSRVKKVLDTADSVIP